MMDLVYPKVCLVCDKKIAKDSVCKYCLSTLELISSRNVCLICGDPYYTLEDKGLYRCGRCLKHEFHFKKSLSIAFYDGFLRELLHDFKYRGKLSLGSLIARIVFDNFPYDSAEIDLIIPVPLHIKKLRKREYNQSAVISSYLSKLTNIESNPYTLVKTINTKPQVIIKSLDERRKNMKNSFLVKSGEAIKDKSVLLFDDVFTTGSTTNECARVLIEAGASDVRVLTVTRSSF